MTHQITRRGRLGIALAAVAALGSVAIGPTTRPLAAQASGRLNPAIAALEQGQPALSGEEWRFFDMEHGAFQMDRLDAFLEQVASDRDENGGLRIAPLVRIPTEGDEDFKWAIKQVLDQGVFGVLIPHVDTGEEAANIVKAMRYPRRKESTLQEPRGLRGWGPARAASYWGLSTVEYYDKADVWPLNPNGELLAIAMIESGEAVGNIEDILRAPGLSAILVVPGDLSIDLGLGPRGDTPFPEVEEAFQTVGAACRAQTAVVCGLADARSNLQQRLDEGWRFILPLGG
jgi:4-hydroxy-2-oxoheptanedioate aldolase